MKAGFPRGGARLRNVSTLLWGLMLSMLLWATMLVRADQTYLYAVQISAVVQEAPPKVTLSWPSDPYGATNYTVYRKTRDATSWGTGTSLSGTATNYVDTNVALGGTYEYKIIKAAQGGYTGYGFIYCGIRGPLIENRGTLALVVATNSTVGLSNELARLQLDLMGDGWQVLRRDVSSNDTPANVRARIISDYNTNAGKLNAVFLFGHVPILQSGNLAYDGHDLRPMPADAFYGDMANDWPTNPATSPSYLPSDVTLMVGRVDLADMPGTASATRWPSETELLRNYLNKDHNWRHKLIPVQRKALMANRIGDLSGEGPAASGYRTFEAMVGPGNTMEANVEDNPQLGPRWISMVSSANYLWSYGCGAGSDTTISYLGTHAQSYDVWSADIVNQDAKAVFVMFFGSWFGNWDHTDNVMRSVLATPTMGLTCCEVGRPHWFFHHMAMGEPIGFSTRLSMNNGTLYTNQVNLFARGVHIGLMGDPSLRLDPVAPPTNLNASAGTNAVNLSWSASPDAVQGYHVYRATSPSGPFSRLTSALVTGSSYSDTTVYSATFTYMVRAVALQTNASGTYLNPSQGIFTTVPVTNSPPIITLQAQPTTNGLRFTWNSQAGTSYRVLASTDLRPVSWIDISGTITAAGGQSSWTDTSFPGLSRRFYRIASP